MPIYNYSTVKWALLAPDAKAVGGVKLSEEELAGGLSHRVHLQQGGGRQQHLQFLQCILTNQREGAHLKELENSKLSFTSSVGVSADKSWKGGGFWVRSDGVYVQEWN